MISNPFARDRAFRDLESDLKALTQSILAERQSIDAALDTLLAVPIDAGRVKELTAGFLTVAAEIGKNDPAGRIVADLRRHAEHPAVVGDRDHRLNPAIYFFTEALSGDAAPVRLHVRELFEFAADRVSHVERGMQAVGILIRKALWESREQDYLERFGEALARHGLTPDNLRTALSAGRLKLGGPAAEVTRRLTWTRLGLVAAIPFLSQRVTEGGEIVLHVAIRHELFAQVGADKRLREMGPTKFTWRATRYGVGTSPRDERPGGERALVLSPEFVADLTATLPDDEPIPEGGGS